MDARERVGVGIIECVMLESLNLPHVLCMGAHPLFRGMSCASAYVEC